MNHYLVHDTPIGELLLEANLDHLIKISFNQKNLKLVNTSLLKKNLILEKTVEQIDEYFFNNRKFFTINYILKTSWFFKKVEMGIIVEDDIDIKGHLISTDFSQPILKASPTN